MLLSKAYSWPSINTSYYYHTISAYLPNHTEKYNFNNECFLLYYKKTSINFMHGSCVQFVPFSTVGANNSEISTRCWLIVWNVDPVLEYPQRRRQLITTAANTYMGRPQKRYRRTNARKHARSGRFLVIIANQWIKKQSINGGHCQISPCRDQHIPAVHQNHILYSSPIIIINSLLSIKDYSF